MFLTLPVFLLAACSAGSGHSEQKTLEMSAEGIDVLEIVSGSGDLGITGDAAAQDISVTADIELGTSDSVEIAETLADRLLFTLEKRGNRAVLELGFRKRFFLLELFQPSGGTVHADITVPAGMKLDIQNDGGDLYLAGMKGDLEIIDGEGECIIEQVTAGSITLEDAAGPISMSGIQGNIEISDKSEAIELSGCSGQIEINDTTDEILVDGCSGELIIIDTGGQISVANHSGDVTIQARGRGDVTLENISGQIIQNF